MPFKSDGNGGYNISKMSLTVFTFLILVIGSIVGIVQANVSTAKDVEYLKENCLTINSGISNLDNRIDATENIIPVINNRLESIEKNIDKIADAIGVLT